MNRGNRYLALRLALALVIMGLVIVGVSLGSPRDRERENRVCPDRAPQAAIQPFERSAGTCRDVDP